MISLPLVPVVSNGRIIVDPIWENPIDDLEGPLYLTYIKQHPTYTTVVVQSKVLQRLELATKNLPSNFQLIVRAGHRPLEVQLQLLNMLKQQYLEEHPSATDIQALAFARTYVSDPSVKVPPHCTGAAVDVDVFDLMTDQLVDFGCPVNTDDPVASLGTRLITRKQRANRKILHTAMCSAGFAPFDAEWWHFSYGDQAWADFYGQAGPLFPEIV